MPLCTRNVFVKYYSKNDIDSHIWSDDANAYLEAIKESLKAYLVVGKMVNNQTMSFYQLISKYKIIISKIQRDYA